MNLTHEGYVTVEPGLRLHYRVVGGGPRTLVIPGDALLGSDLQELADKRRIVFYDMRNRGRSDTASDPSQIGFEQEISDLEAIRQYLRLDEVELLGWSYMGAVAALHAARHQEHIRRLLLVAPMLLKRKPMTPEIGARINIRTDAGGLKRLEDMRRAGLHLSDPVAYCREYTRVHRPRQLAHPSALARIKSDPCDLPNEWPSNVNKTFALLFASIGDWDWTSEVASITVPTLVVFGAQDLATSEDVREWPRALGNARLLLIPSVGHFPWAEDPDAFFPAVRQFLDGTWPERAVSFSQSREQT